MFTHTHTLCRFFQPLSSITHGSGAAAAGGRGGSFVFSTAREWHVYVISFPLTYIIHKVSQKVSIKKTARIKSEKRDAFKASCVFDDDTRAISNRRWEKRRPRRLYLQTTIRWRKTQKRFVFITTTSRSRKVKVKMHKKRVSNCHTKKASQKEPNAQKRSLS